MSAQPAVQGARVQVEFGGGYNRNSARLIMAEVVREHGQHAANLLISEMHLDEVFGFMPVPAPQ